MKPSMMFAVVVLAAIVIATAFGLSFSGTDAVVPVAPELAGQELYVCPAESSTWTSVANALAPVRKFFVIGLFFAVLVLLFSWGWGLYQNLLKDEFKKDAYSKPWEMTKMLFWATVLLLLLNFTPNYFRTVKVNGLPGNWVICENTDTEAKVVPASSVIAD